MTIDWSRIPAAIWRRHLDGLRPVSRLDTVRLEDLLGVERQKQALQDNIERFLKGMPANNILLWGARGTGKSSLVKALLNRYLADGLLVLPASKVPEVVDHLFSGL